MDDEREGGGTPLADVDDLIRRLEQGGVPADRGAVLLLMDAHIARAWPTGAEEPCTASAWPIRAVRVAHILNNPPPDRPREVLDRGLLGTHGDQYPGDTILLLTRDAD